MGLKECPPCNNAHIVFMWFLNLSSILHGSHSTIKKVSDLNEHKSIT